VKNPPKTSAKNASSKRNTKISPCTIGQQFLHSSVNLIEKIGANTEFKPHFTSPSIEELASNPDYVDRLSQELGIPWETSKDIPFASEVPFIGFLWNLTDSSVSIPVRKKSKYLAAIVLWESHQTHMLEEVQKLYGKLLQASLIVPMGRAYLTNMVSWGSSITILSSHAPPARYSRRSALVETPPMPSPCLPTHPWTQAPHEYYVKSTRLDFT